MKIGAIIQSWYGAIAIYDTVLKFAPNDLKTLKRKGFTLEKLSELQLSQQQYTEAIKALKQAIAYDSAFSRYHSDAIDISYHGMMIERLAELYLTNKQYTEAFATYQQALATYETAIQHLEVADTREQAIVYWSNTKLGCKSSHPFSPMRRICHQLSKLLRASVFKLQDHAATSGVTPSILELLAFRDYGKIQDYAGETWLTLKQDLLQTLQNQPDLGIREAQVDIFLHEGLINDATKTVERDTYYDSKLVH